MAEGDVFHQADALMQRHRSFVARPAQDAPAPQAADPDADIPVLTEVVDATAINALSGNALLDRLQADIEQELSAWLVDALPAAVTNASLHIIAELDAKARNTLLPQLQALIDTHRKPVE